MAFICEKDIPCKECVHYRYDEDRQRMACFAAVDAQREDAAKMLEAETKETPCFMCNNARVCDELTDDNDLSYHSVGCCEKGFRLLLRAGDRKPVAILSERWNESREVWETLGLYTPKFCPNCGRALTEYSNHT